MSKPIATHPYYLIHDWTDHQAETTSAWIKNYTVLLSHPRYKRLSLSARGVLHGLWLWRGETGLNPSRDPGEAALSLSCRRTKHMVGHLKELELQGFLKPTRNRRSLQRRVDKRRGDKKRTDARRVSNLPTGFSEFWTRYPRKVGKPKAAAAWVKHGCLDLAGQIMPALEQHRVSEQWTKDGGKFIPYPATWLNREGWTDELEPATKRKREYEPTEAEIAASVLEMRREQGHA